MLKNVLNQPNVIGRLMIVLLFAGGVVFAGAFNGFVVETEASSCCGGGTSIDIFSSSSNNDDDDDEACTCIDGGHCGECDTKDCGGTHSRYCADGCTQDSNEGCYCTTTDCDKTSEEACSSPCSH